MRPSADTVKKGVLILLGIVLVFEQFVPISLCEQRIHKWRDFVPKKPATKYWFNQTEIPYDITVTEDMINKWRSRIVCGVVTLCIAISISGVSAYTVNVIGNFVLGAVYGAAVFLLISSLIVAIIDDTPELHLVGHYPQIGAFSMLLLVMSGTLLLLLKRMMSVFWASML